MNCDSACVLEAEKLHGVAKSPQDVKIALEQAMKAQRRSRGIALYFFLNLGAG